MDFQSTKHWMFEVECWLNVHKISCSAAWVSATAGATRSLFSCTVDMPLRSLKSARAHHAVAGLQAGFHANKIAMHPAGADEFLLRNQVRHPASYLRFNHVNRIAIRRAQNCRRRNRQHGLLLRQNHLHAHEHSRPQHFPHFQTSPATARCASSRQVGIDGRQRAVEIGRDKLSLVTCTTNPVCSWARFCCGSEKSTKTGVSACKETIGLPTSSNSPPRFTSRMPKPAGERRADGFLFNRRADRVGIGLVLFQRGVGLVQLGLGNGVVRAQFLRARPAFSFASSTCASAARTCASSDEVSSRTSKSPLATPRRIQRRFRSPSRRFLARR
jgi:hypothetical protein